MQTIPAERVWLTPAQAAEYVQVHPNTVYDWIKVYGLRHRRVGRMIRIRRDWLDAFLEQGTQE